eukprot:TRINITY_DN5139_c0_g1_i1.p1 TRINITY_DN5139_c0_g1~~TRINITY_DN5139_c0_g1_i1.p1  ORF type:complete len:302 (+),score=39.79 TRINITY_DN5139_c0_g1_i1:94-999(+)
MSLKDNLPNPAPSPSPSSAMAGTLSQRSPQQTRTKEVPEEPSAPGSFLFGNTRYFELNKLYAQYHNAFRKNKGIADWPSRSKHLVLSYLVDWIVLVMLLALLGLHYAKPPVFYFRLDDPDISYPFVDQTISATAITLVIILGPLAVVAFAQIWVRSMRDFHQSAMATLQLFVITQLICEFMWTLVGGLRPNFLAICKPSVPIPQVWTPVQYYDDSICTCSETELIRAKHAFPSGHAASITAVCVYLAIYVSAKLKVFDNRSHLWKFVVSILAFFVIDVWISFSRIRDGQHHHHRHRIASLV